MNANSDYFFYFDFKSSKLNLQMSSNVKQIEDTKLDAWYLFLTHSYKNLTYFLPFCIGSFTGQVFPQLYFAKASVNANSPNLCPI